jgi:cytochrome c oxidase subunit 3
MGSIAMMFAGLTSAYVVKQSAGSWRNFHLPYSFMFSTAAILSSSFTIHFALRAFKNRHMKRYQSLIAVTLLLGVSFGVLQYLGFYQLYHTPQQVVMNGQAASSYATVRVDGNPSESFLFIIAGLHLAHIIGGIIALLITWIRTFRRSIRVYSSTGLEIVASYWHFVDILWIYLFLFFLAYQ